MNLDKVLWRSVTVELAQELRSHFGPRFKGLVLYGSWARSEATEESDVDFLVLLTDFEDFWEESRWVGEIGWQLSCKYDLLVSLHLARFEDYQHKITPFFMNVRREGILVA
ncbi:MAG: nucleotidyltransferase domain-containing protein [Chloroflexi bacterium]|nr:nucleotidyltransferase domain-containing protein [Chloroflexota bacterium]